MYSNALKKSVVGILLFCFLFAVEMPLLPLPAAPGPDETPVAVENDSQPGILEVEGGSASKASASKSSFLPILAAAIGAGILTAVLVFVVSKKSYDIIGKWRLTIEYNNVPSGYNFGFAGSREEGSFSIVSGSLSLGSGTYKVDGKDVSIMINWKGDDVANLIGVFTDADHMEGSYTETPHYSGRWYASRVDDATPSELKESAAVDRHLR